MIGYKHNVAWEKLRIYPACRVCYYHCPYAKALHDPDGQSNLGHTITFVKVNASLHDKHRLVFQFTDHNAACMTKDGGNREMRQFPKRNNIRAFYRFGKFIQTGAKDDGNPRLISGALTKPFDNFIYLIEGKMGRHS